MQRGSWRWRTSLFTAEKAKQLKVPEGFEVSIFAQNLGNVRMMAVADNGMVYVTRPMEKDVPAFIAPQNSCETESCSPPSYGTTVT